MLSINIQAMNRCITFSILVLHPSCLFLFWVWPLSFQVHPCINCPCKCWIFLDIVNIGESPRRSLRLSSKGQLSGDSLEGDMDVPVTKHSKQVVHDTAKEIVSPVVGAKGKKGGENAGSSLVKNIVWVFCVCQEGCTFWNSLSSEPWDIHLNKGRNSSLARWYAFINLCGQKENVAVDDFLTKYLPLKTKQLSDSLLLCSWLLIQPKVLQQHH